MTRDLPDTVIRVLDELRDDESTLEIWLVGSRVSGCAGPTSDWDLLVFSAREPETHSVRAEGVDVLLKGPSGAVLLEGMPMSLMLKFSDFQWRELGPGRAKYRGRKFLTGVADALRDAATPAQIFTEGVATLLWKRTMPEPHTKSQERMRGK